jgi:homoserine kinase
VSQFEPFSLRVPATSANLGPGFDAVGIALALCVRAEVSPAGAFDLTFDSGNELPSHGGFASAITRAMLRINPALPPARIRISNDIPLGKGLGASAAAIVLGLAIALRARGRVVALRTLAHLACELEGHPDNALPAIFGGAVIAVSGNAGSYVRVGAPRGLRAIVVVPAFDLATSDARALLPAHYRRSDVVFTAQRAALLGAALASGAWSELRVAMRDRMHQPYRARRIPGMQEALAVDARCLIGTALSGAGPSLIALVRDGSAWQSTARRLEACFTRAGVTARSYSLAPSGEGLRIRSLARG